MHLARRMIEEHVAELSHGEVRPFRAEQHDAYQQRVFEVLSVAGDAVASAYPMLERIAQALDAGEMLRGHTAEHSQTPRARRSVAP